MLAARAVGRRGVEARQRAVERRVRRDGRRPLAPPKAREGRAVRVLDRAGRLGVQLRGGGGQFAEHLLRGAALGELLLVVAPLRLHHSE